MTILTAESWRGSVTAEHIKRDMKMESGDSLDGEINRLVGEARQIGLPKAAARLCRVESRGNDHMLIDGIQTRSSLLIEKLAGSETVVAYAATCGRELHDWAAAYASDPVCEFICSSIMKSALPAAYALLKKWMLTNAGYKSYASLNPGSLPSWPLTAQKQVFGLLSGRENDFDPAAVGRAVGIELTPSFLMLPLKSVSGIYFETDEEWHNCSRCKKTDCENRRAPMSMDAEDMITEAGMVEVIPI